MRTLIALSLSLALGAVSVAACKSENDGVVTSVSTAESESLPCAVDDVLARRCRGCHAETPQFGAPMSLVRESDVVATGSGGKKRFELVGERIHSTQRPMPPPPNDALDASDLATLDGWIASGAPARAASESCSPPVAAKPADGRPALSCKPDVTMLPASAFAMPKGADDLYICYGFDVPIGGKRHLTAIAPKLDNTKIIHHLVLYDTDVVASTTPGSCDIAGLAKARLLYGWAPGTGNLELPIEAGYPIDGTRHFVVQIHYNNVKHLDGETDASGFEFCTTDQLRANDADALTFGTEDFTIPAKGVADVTCDYTWPATAPAVHVFSALPHMHQLGDLITTTQFPGGSGAAVDLGGQQSWDFQNQILVPVDATLRPGDRIETRCRWKNPSDRPVSFGPTTEDEMCFSYTMYYPRFAFDGWSYRTPATESKCTPSK
ncbi:MAG: hypothetical protein JWO86_5696 [Myxococcaceae bacterium]|nr:hypothetical protein [Myxococcaceae bacterium]